ncbi:sulfotransferase family protein [Shimia sp.]|uniref:sulfotransferase family protein n=1 Tax=Shimia sp. TaxID=1954381 RepID=UPI003B8BEDF8
MHDTPTWLFCIGAQKAGTTWLYDYCAKHPEIHVPSVKEIHYFNVLHDANQLEFANSRRAMLEARKSRRLGASLNDMLRKKMPGDDYSEKTLSALAKMYDDDSQEHLVYQEFVTAGRKTEKVVADITPDYGVLRPSAFADMASFSDGAKFLFLMRDPIERTWSNIKMHSSFLKARGKADLNEMELVDRILKGRQAHILQRSMYQRTLFNLRQVASPEQIQVLFYENLFSDASMKQLCDFLGVAFASGDYKTRIREGKLETVPEEAFNKLAPLLRVVYQRIVENYADQMPDSWHTERVLSQPLLQVAS